MKVLITLTDVEPAVRLNAVIEAAGHKTAVVSPLDDLRGEIKRFKPDLIVLTARRAGQIHDQRLAPHSGDTTP